MQSKIIRFLFYFIPPVIWMSVIYYFSSHTRTQLAEDQILNFLIFKSFHVIEYAILFFLIFRSSYFFKKNKFILSYRFILVFFITLLYAISDEFHQTLVPTREGIPRDVLIDLIGMIVMYTGIKIKFKLIKKFL